MLIESALRSALSCLVALAVSYVVAFDESETVREMKFETVEIKRRKRPDVLLR